MLQPMHDNVLVNPMAKDEGQLREFKTDKGIIVTSHYFTGDQRAEVLAVGPGMRDAKGKRKRIKYKPGDMVVCLKDTPVAVQDNGQDYYFVRADQIIAKLERD